MIYALGRSVKEVIIPVIYFFVLNFNNQSRFIKIGSIALIIYMIYRVVSIFLQWKNYTYCFSDKNLEIIEGRFVANKRYITLDRIQGVQQHTTFIHRLFGLTSLTIMTRTTGDNATVKLEMINRQEATFIQDILKQHKTETHASEAEMTPIAENIEVPVTKHYKMSIKEIFLISLTSLYFLAIIPIILSIYFKLDEIFSLERYLERALVISNQSWIFITFIAIITLIIFVCFGLAYTYLRFGNYEVSSDDKHIYIAKGVFNKTTFTITKENINGILINKGIFRRLFHIVEVKLITLGDLFDEAEMKTDILFPFISEKQAKQLLSEILPAFQIKNNMIPLPKPALFVNLIRPSYLLVIVTVIVFFFWPEYWFVPAGLFILIVSLRILDYKQSKYTINESFIQFQSGALSTELFITTRAKIDELVVHQSWLQRKLGLATLAITSRAKPIHVAELANMPWNVAYYCYNWYRVEEKNPSF